MDMQSKHHSEESARPEGVLLLINLKSGGAKERGVVSSSVLSATAAHLELSPSKRSPPRRVQFLDFLWKGPANSLLSRDPGFRLPGAALTKSERQRRPIERKMRGESYLKLLASEDGGDGKSSTRQGTDTRYSEGTASILSCTINLANTCIGTGMFGLPAAFASSGYALGSLLLMAACMFAANGLRLLTMSAEKVGIRSDRPASFYSIASAALPQFTVAIDFAVALKCFGVATSYLITVGDCMVEAIRYVFQNHLDHMDSTAHSAASSFVASRQFWVLSAVIMVIPMSFHGTLDALHCASTLSLFLVHMRWRRGLSCTQREFSTLARASQCCMHITTTQHLVMILHCKGNPFPNRQGNCCNPQTKPSPRSCLITQQPFRHLKRCARAKSKRGMMLVRLCAILRFLCFPFVAIRTFFQWSMKSRTEHSHASTRLSPVPCALRFYFILWLPSKVI